MNLSFTIAGKNFTFGSPKSVSPGLADWLRGGSEDDGSGAKLTSPYSQSAWVYIAVNRIASKIASIPFRISRMDDAPARRVRALRSSSSGKHRVAARRALDESIIESGPAVDLFNQPHPHMSRQLFWEMCVTWACLRGEFFVLPLDTADQPVDMTTAKPRVDRLITLGPEYFWHIVSGYELSGWRYTGSPLLSPLPSQILLPSEVIHSRNSNPYLFWRGLSPLGVAALAANADYAAAKYNQGYWLNNADTGVIVTTDQQATPEQRAAILAALRERKRKAGTADRPLFLWGGAKVEKPQLSGMESQFIANRDMNRREIGAIYGVPESVMGFSADKSSALSGGGLAISAEQLQFIEQTVMPLCCQIESALEPVVNSFGPGLIGWFDVESLPVMQEARRTRLDTAVKAFGIGVPLNDANSVYDLGLPEYDWGDKSFLPFSVQEVGAESELPGEDDPTDPEEATDTADTTDTAKGNPFARMTALLTRLQTLDVKLKTPDTKVLWASHIAQRRKMVRVMQAKVGKVLNEFRRSTLAKLDEVHMGKSFEKRGLVDLVFNAHAFGERLLDTLTNPITATLQLAGNELRQEIGLHDPWQMPPDAAKDYLAQRTQAIQGCGETVRNQINTTLQAGLDAGETTRELSDRIRAVFNDLTRGEAERIARTETNMAYNDARHEAMTDAGIEYKAWLSSHGPNVREGHQIAEEQYLDNPIPVDDPFIVMGEQLMYPGDDSLGATAGNIINCQCVQLAAQKTGEDATTTTFKIFGAGNFTFPKP